MDDQCTMQILDLLHTIQEACPTLYTAAESEDTRQFQQLRSDMASGLSQLLRYAEKTDTVGYQKLRLACLSNLDSLQRIGGYYGNNRGMCLKKIEFELLPLLQEAYLSFYFFQYIATHPEYLDEYHAREKNLLCGNSYIDEALNTGKYKYEVSFFVLGYNKLNYTRQCVESLLANIPQDLKYELILINHGSTDGTKEYFESLHPHKQLDIAVNGGGVAAISRIVEGEFAMQISNDVIITPHAIENMLACMRSDPQIAWVVPTTSNISNLQTIPAQYETLDGLLNFARENNISDAFRWEQRVRLCNPLDMRRNSVFFASRGLCIGGSYHTTDPIHATSFPDDRTSLFLRRSGYKLMLAKDAYCHHFGSVTLKDEIRQQNEQKYYLEGRRHFYQAFGVDPWGTGFCYDPVFMNRVVGDERGHVDILGINCGLGSNSLKIKEQIKEYCHSMDVTLHNVTSDGRFLQDLEGISDKALFVRNLRDLKVFLTAKLFSYIVWEESIFPKISAKTLLRTIQGVLQPDGRLFAKKNGQLDALLTADRGWLQLSKDWYVYRKVYEESYEG